MKKFLLSTSAMALAAGALAGPAIADEDVTAWRLFVADREAPAVTVVDAVEREVIGTFEVDFPAALHRTTSGETVFAVVGDQGSVSVISTGIAFHDHGDHADISLEDAALLDVTLTGDRPAHFVEFGGNIAQWFDGEDEARFFSERSVLAGDPDIRTVNVAAPHHGVAVPFDNHAVVTIPNPEDASQRPVGARVVDFEGNQVGGDVDCPGLHGSAGSGSLYALACDTGILLISRTGDAPEITHLAYSGDLPEGSSSTLIGGTGLQYFIGNYGADRIVIIDPAEENFQLVQLPTRRVHFATDPVRARFAYVFTEDGQLHRVDVLEGAITESLRLTGPYSMEGHWNDPRPRIAVAAGDIIVTDPAEGVLRVVDAASFEETGQIAVEGTPFNIVAVGGTGVVHGHDHDHDHDHGHDHD